MSKKTTYGRDDDARRDLPRVAEAAVAYQATAAVENAPEPEHGQTRLSGKNQLTLPAAMVRDLGWQAGDELELTRIGAEVTIRLRPRTPQEWVARFRGAMKHVPEWQTKESIDAWVRRERDSWDREWDENDS